MKSPGMLCVSWRGASCEKKYPKSGAMLPIISAVSGRRCLPKRSSGKTAAAWEMVKGTARDYRELMPCRSRKHLQASVLHLRFVVLVGRCFRVTDRLAPAGQADQC